MNIGLQLSDSRGPAAPPRSRGGGTTARIIIPTDGRAIRAPGGNLQICLRMWADNEGVTTASTTPSSGHSTSRSRFGARIPRSWSREGASGQTLRLVARYAQACNLVAPPQLEHKLDVLRIHCEAVGRDYDDIEKTAVLPMDSGPDGENVDAILTELEWPAGLGFAQAHSRVPRAGDIAPLELFGEWIIPIAADF